MLNYKGLKTSRLFLATMLFIPSIFLHAEPQCDFPSTYRDALLGTRGSYILYPGSEENHEVYVGNPVKAYRDNNIMPSIGAFPLKPTENDLQALQMNSIKVHLESCIQRLLNSDLKYIEEYGFKKLSPQYENLRNSLFFKCL